jgi:hypothetical protein
MQNRQILCLALCILAPWPVALIYVSQCTWLVLIKLQFITTALLSSSSIMEVLTISLIPYYYCYYYYYY